MLNNNVTFKVKPVIYCCYKNNTKMVILKGYFSLSYSVDFLVLFTMHFESLTLTD